MNRSSTFISCLPLIGIGEIRMGDNLAEILGAATPLLDGDILVVTSKAISKAEGRVRAGDRTEMLADETDRVVAARGSTSIVRTHHGLVMAAAGIDGSNTAPGTVVLLPVDPDASARALREHIGSDGGPNVAIVISDTSGRAWRNGQTDIAIGAAGLDVIHDYAGRADDYGNLLEVTAPAVADEIAGTGDLVKGKVHRSPAAVLRGLSHLVLDPGSHGPGAQMLIRDEADDMFGHGAREAVLHAVAAKPEALRGFGRRAPIAELVAALAAHCGTEHVRTTPADEVEIRVSGGPDVADQRALGGLEARLTAVAFAMGWICTTTGWPIPGLDLMLRFVAPTP